LFKDDFLASLQQLLSCDGVPCGAAAALAFFVTKAGLVTLKDARGQMKWALRAHAKLSFKSPSDVMSTQEPASQKALDALSSLCAYLRGPSQKAPSYATSFYQVAMRKSRVPTVHWFHSALQQIHAFVRVYAQAHNYDTAAVDRFLADLDRDIVEECFIDQPSDYEPPAAVSILLAKAWTSAALCCTCADACRNGDGKVTVDHCDKAKGFYSMLQHCLRAEDVFLLLHAAPLIKAINMFLITHAITRRTKAASACPSEETFQLYRGSAMPQDEINFLFLAFGTDLVYRVAPYFAASKAYGKARDFLEDAELGDGRQKVLYTVQAASCFHAAYLEGVTTVKQEFEVLIAPYSRFKVKDIRRDNDNDIYVVALEVMKDNLEGSGSEPVRTWC